MDSDANLRNTPSRDQTGFKNVYVKNFGNTWNDSQLFKNFRRFGQIVSSRVAKDENGESLGFGFVCFETHESAKAAVLEMNGSVLNGLKLYVAEHKKREERAREMYINICSTGTNVYVKNLHASIDDKELKRLFQPYGKIASAKVAVDPLTKQSKMHGFVNFSTPEEAANAIIALNHSEYKNRKLNVCLFIPSKIRKDLIGIEEKMGSRTATSNDFTMPKTFSTQNNVSIDDQISNMVAPFQHALSDLSGSYTRGSGSEASKVFPQYQLTPESDSSFCLGNLYHHINAIRSDPLEKDPLFQKEKFHVQTCQQEFQTLVHSDLAYDEQLQKNDMIAPFAAPLFDNRHLTCPPYNENPAGEQNFVGEKDSPKHKKRLPLAAKFNSEASLPFAQSSNESHSFQEK